MTRNTSRRWFWFLLFLGLAVLIGALATSYNFLVVDGFKKGYQLGYERTLEFARSMKAPEPAPISTPSTNWTAIIFGTLGFVAALGGIILFFFRLLREMKLTQTQSEFIANVSHELKTPIATLKLTSSLLQRDAQTSALSLEEQDRLWRSHNEELERLRSQVETLLEAARWQSGLPALKPQEIHLETWLKESWQRWQEILGPGASLTREGQTLDLEASLDLNVLDLVAKNLVENAGKFAKGSPKLTVRTRNGSSDPLDVSGKSNAPNNWEIQFQDEGWGFDPSVSKRIFTRFFRATTEAPYAIPGSGLGLSLVEAACKALKIEVIASSPGPGHGATFTLRSLQK